MIALWIILYIILSFLVAVGSLALSDSEEESERIVKEGKIHAGDLGMLVMGMLFWPIMSVAIIIIFLGKILILIPSKIFLYSYKGIYWLRKEKTNPRENV